MLANTYLNLLIFYGILCQRIIEGHLEEGKSSNLLIRKKRVVNNGPNRELSVEIKNYGYIVSILHNREGHHCVGAILSLNYVITAAKCVVHPVTEYRIIAGTAKFTNDYKIHNITTKNIRLANDIHRPTDGIALVTVHPIFKFSRTIRIISLHRLPVQPGTHAVVAGWGCSTEEHDPARETPSRLETINVPVISNEECANAYRNFFPITEKDICTHDESGQQYCGVTDQGAPLVIQLQSRRYHLIGINIWGGSLVDQSRPDIYVNLEHPHYKNWLEDFMIF